MQLRRVLGVCEKCASDRDASSASKFALSNINVEATVMSLASPFGIIVDRKLDRRRQNVATISATLLDSATNSDDNSCEQFTQIANGAKMSVDKNVLRASNHCPVSSCGASVNGLARAVHDCCFR